jgi:quercetin dioxygenase-like cupin family protein
MAVLGLVVLLLADAHGGVHNKSEFDNNYMMNTNILPWVDLPGAPGCHFKPLRVSRETGQFAAVIRMLDGVTFPNTLHFGAFDFLVLEGHLTYPDGYLQGELGPATWGYVPANARVNGSTATGDVEFLANFFGPVAFVAADGETITGLFTGQDVKSAADRHRITLVPSTHLQSQALRKAGKAPSAFQGDGEPLKAFASGAAPICSQEEPDHSRATARRPHYVDTNSIPWTPTPGAPDVKVKILRVSEETGLVNLIVSQRAVVPPHKHLGPSDFIILEGTMGLVGGRSEGYGPGSWIYEEAGARHEGTFQQSEEPLVYLANIYGPVMFDNGPGTQIQVVAQFEDYLDIAQMANFTLIRSVFPDDPSLLAHSGLGSAATCKPAL